MLLQTPPLQTVITRARLFCTNCDSSTDQSTNDEDPQPKKLRSSTDEETVVGPKDVESGVGPCVTSTPACVALHFTPDEQDRKSMSPITRSTQRMTRAMQVRGKSPFLRLVLTACLLTCRCHSFAILSRTSSRPFLTQCLYRKL
jgi:hypothetical protein